MIEESKPSRRQHLLAALYAEVELQEEHLDLLLSQKAALVACDRESFAMLHALHEDLADRLEVQARNRMTAFPQDGASLIDEIESWPVGLRGEAMELVARLRSAIEQVQTQSEQNQTLIANDLHLVDFQLNLIMAAIKQGPHYASSGTSEPMQANRLINRVA